MPVTRRRTVRRRRNPGVDALIAEAEAIPALSAADLRALPTDAFDQYGSLLGTMKEELRRARVSAERLDYDRIGRTMAALQPFSLAWSDEWYARDAAKKKAAKEARQAKAAARAAKKSAGEAAAGLVGSNYFPASAKVRLGEKVYADEGDVFKVTGLASASDPHNEQYAASLVASGLLDKRNHRGNWAVIERGSDALLVSIGKGPKRNPRRRRAPARRRR